MNVAEQLEHRRLNEVHRCAVASCGERARTAYMADADGHLAGRWWWRGDFIDLCPHHAAMLYDGKDPAA